MNVLCVIILCYFRLLFGCEIGDRTLNCSGLNLTRVPELDLFNIKTTLEVLSLNLSFNFIQSPVNFSRWSDSAVSVLDLSFNNLTVINTESFSGLKDLKVLNLSSNSLTSINFEWSRLASLQLLSLANNDFPHGNLNIFKDIWKSSISHLNLSCTNFSPPSPGVFMKAVNLTILDLSKNKLTFIPTLPSNLKYLDCGYNGIEYLDHEYFDKDIRLKTLLLENNTRLKDVSIESFKHLLELRVLSFRGCSSLSYLPSSIFYYNRRIEYLSLAQCNFTNISVGFKSSFQNIKKIELEENPWHCNVHIKWLVQLHDRKIISDDIRCSKPENISLVEFLGPKIKHKVVRILLTLVSLFLFCMLITAAIFSCNMENKRRKTLNSYSPLERSSKPYRGSMIYVTSSV